MPYTLFCTILPLTTCLEADHHHALRLESLEDPSMGDVEASLNGLNGLNEE